MKDSVDHNCFNRIKFKKKKEKIRNTIYEYFPQETGLAFFKFFRALSNNLFLVRQKSKEQKGAHCEINLLLKT